MAKKATKNPTKKPATKSGPAYATRNVSVGGKSFAIGDEIKGEPAEIERIIRIGKASRTFPKNLVNAVANAAKTRRKAELAADQAASEEFESAVEQTAERVSGSMAAKAKGVAKRAVKKLTGQG